MATEDKIVKLVDGENTDIQATVDELVSANALVVEVVDGNGDQITSFGGGTQYTEDAAAAANPVGTVPILVRQDTPAGLVTTDGDNVGQRGTNYGAAYVTLLDTSGNAVAVSGGTQYTEDAAAAANPVGTALNLIRADALAGVTTTDGDNVAARGTDKGELYVKHADSIAVTSATFATAAKQDTIIGHVDGIETLLTAIDGHVDGLETSNSAIQTSVELIDNAISGAGFNITQQGGVAVSLNTGVRDAGTQRVTIATNDVVPVSQSGTWDEVGINDSGNSITVDNAQLSVVGSGTEATAMRVTLATDSTGLVSVDDNGASLSVDWNGTQPVTGNGNATGALRVSLANNSTGVLATVTDVTTLTTLTGSSIAHDGVDSGNPHKIGFKAYSPDGTTPGVVAELDRTDAKGDLNGRMFVNAVHPQNFSYHDDDAAAVTTDGTAAADPGDGFAVFITDIIFSIGAATASSIFLEEGSTKILGPYYLEAVAGRSMHLKFETPKRCTASTAILVTNTGSILFSIDILGFVAAV